MADVKWIKIHTGIFDDEKIKLIDSMPDRDAVFVIWIKLLTLAGRVNDNGMIYVSEEMPYTDEMYAAIFNRPVNTVKMALDIFRKFNMIDILEGKTHISNWEKHQNIDGLEKIREANRKRVAKYRENAKLLTGSVTGNVTVTDCNAIDKNKNKSKNISFYVQHHHLKLTETEREELIKKYSKKDVDDMIKKIKSLSAAYLSKYDNMFLIIDAWIEKEKDKIDSTKQSSDAIDDLIKKYG